MKEQAYDLDRLERVLSGWSHRFGGCTLNYTSGSITFKAVIDNSGTNTVVFGDTLKTLIDEAAAILDVIDIEHKADRMEMTKKFIGCSTLEEWLDQFFKALASEGAVVDGKSHLAVVILEVLLDMDETEVVKQLEKRLQSDTSPTVIAGILKCAARIGAVSKQGEWGLRWAGDALHYPSFAEQEAALSVIKAWGKYYKEECLALLREYMDSKQIHYMLTDHAQQIFEEIEEQC